MNRPGAAAAAACAIAGFGATLPLPVAAAEAVALVGARVYPVSSDPIPDGVVLIRDGRILAVGARDRVQIPEGARLRELGGRVIIPGLVDTHSHIALSGRPLVRANRGTNESSHPVTPEMRAIDGIWPGDPAIRMAVTGGVTTVNIMPGSGNVVSGQTAYVKLRGSSVNEMLIKGAGGHPVPGGMKMANGENPKRTHGSRNKAPMTRMAAAKLERQLFIDALEYQAKQVRYQDQVARGENPSPPELDLGLAPVVEVLDGLRIVHHHTHRADDIRTVLRIQDEFGHRVVIQHGTEAHKLADELARRGVPVSAIVLDAPGGKHEAIELDYRGPAILERAGVKVALHTDDYITDSRLFLRSGGLAIRGGMSEAGALRALTLSGAEMLDLADRIGSLEPGKEADLVVLSGEPFAVRTRVLETWIDGEQRFDRGDPEDRLYQTGGFQLPDRYPRGVVP